MQTSTSTNLFVDNRWNTSANREGDIKYLRETNKPVLPAICIKRWQNLEFMPLDELSAAHWMRHRHTIAEHFKPPVQPEQFGYFAFRDTIRGSTQTMADKEPSI